MTNRSYNYWGRTATVVGMGFGAMLHFKIVCWLAFLYGGLIAVYVAGSVTLLLLTIWIVAMIVAAPQHYEPRNFWSFLGMTLMGVCLGFIGHYFALPAFIQRVISSV